MRSFEGQWTVVQLPNGRCSIHHRLSLVPSTRPPEAIEGAVLGILETQTRGIMEDLQAALPARTGNEGGSEEGEGEEGGSGQEVRVCNLWGSRSAVDD